MGKTIKVAIVGAGNCASALVQGIAYYKTRKEDEAIGLLYYEAPTPADE
jgi:myo-inositol-1-phosphate synthase